MKKIGEFTKEIIDLLELTIEPSTPIFIGDSNITHMKTRHPVEFERYFRHIEDIIAIPDYVGNNKDGSSVDFVKSFKIDGDYVQVSVRVSASGVFFARTLFMLTTYKAERYIERGTLKKLDKK